MPSIPSHKKMFSEPSSPTPNSFQFQQGTEQRARDWRCFLYGWDQILFLGSLVYKLSDFLDNALHHLFYPLPTPTHHHWPSSCSWNRHDLKGLRHLWPEHPQNKTGASHCIAEENLKEKGERDNKSEVNKRHKEDKISPHVWLGPTAATEVGLPFNSMGTRLCPCELLSEGQRTQQFSSLHSYA